MPVMLERWNDDKMDALDGKVGGTAERMAVLEVKVDALDKRFDKVDKRFEKVDEDLKGMQRLITQGAIAISGSMALGFVTMATVMVVKL